MDLDKAISLTVARFKQKIINDLDERGIVITRRLRNSVNAIVNKLGANSWKIDISYIEYGDVLESLSFRESSEFRYSEKIEQNRKNYRIFRRRYKYLSNNIEDAVVKYNLRDFGRLFIREIEK